MCGIAGVVSDRSGAPLQEAVFSAIEAFKHRGPDETGYGEWPGTFLAMCRLSIIDLKHGSQPVYSEDGGVVAVFNGEIYNYRELAKSLRERGHVLNSDADSEVLVHLYEECGTAFLDKLDGMFAIALYDRKEGVFLLARDRLGKKPLYYANVPGGGLAFASELKGLVPLLDRLGISATVSDQSIFDYLSFGVVPQPGTIYKEIRCIAPGSMMVMSAAGSTVTQYWSPTFEPKLRLSYEDAKAKTRELVGAATKKRLVSDVPVGVFLSGGVDSSVVAYEIAKQGGIGVDAFTVGFEGFANDESMVAQRTAKRFGLKSHSVSLPLSPAELIPKVVKHYDQPYADSSAIPSMAISEFASKHVKVVLNGDGGDELFAGYGRYLMTRYLQRGLTTPPRARKFFSLLERPVSHVPGSAGRRIGRLQRSLAASWEQQYLMWTVDMFDTRDKELAWIGNPQSPSERIVSELNIPALNMLDRQINAELSIVLLSDLLVKMDMATMAHSVEARSPLLDFHLAEFAFRLPANFRVRNGRRKALLKDSYRGLIPDEVIDSPKRGFSVPMGEWMGNDLRPMVGDLFESGEPLISSYLDPMFVRRLFNGTEMANKNTDFLRYSLLVLELWLRDRP
ncbi:asparagine synthase (glutamine-hydrolyzing) [Dietzia cercidiphylli]|uniref:asparagine synthase (glutamine-hydrolyzing) n=1 Tax=Dietzia cercidiphylli TaxID=498199 RepID=A0ABN2I5Q3_9ACTN|nr:asparagine synthase (glutamine-hydrolyzing) [Dietzia cercidiphylli]